MEVHKADFIKVMTAQLDGESPLEYEVMEVWNLVKPANEGHGSGQGTAGASEVLLLDEAIAAISKWRTMIPWRTLANRLHQKHHDLQGKSQDSHHETLSMLLSDAGASQQHPTPEEVLHVAALCGWDDFGPHHRLGIRDVHRAVECWYELYPELDAFLALGKLLEADEHLEEMEKNHHLRAMAEAVAFEEGLGH